MEPSENMPPHAIELHLELRLGGFGLLILVHTARLVSISPPGAPRLSAIDTADHGRQISRPFWKPRRARGHGNDQRAGRCRAHGPSLWPPTSPSALPIVFFLVWYPEPAAAKRHNRAHDGRRQFNWAQPQGEALGRYSARPTFLVRSNWSIAGAERTRIRMLAYVLIACLVGPRDSDVLGPLISKLRHIKLNR